MALKAITINTDTAQDPHIYAIDDAEIFNSIIGGEGVHNWEENFAAEIIDNNTVRIKSGVLNIQGHFARTGKEEYTDITIENGSQTLNRNDLIVAEFRTDSGIDNIGFKVIKGESSEYAEDPGYVQEDLLSNGLVRQLPLYRVVINKLVLESLQPMFSPLPTLAQLTDMQEEIEQLNSDLPMFEFGEAGTWANPGETRTVKVSFNKKFPSTPYIFAQNIDTASPRINISVGNKLQSECTFYVRNQTGNGEFFNFVWMAILYPIQKNSIKNLSNFSVYTTEQELCTPFSTYSHRYT